MSSRAWLCRGLCLKRKHTQRIKESLKVLTNQNSQGSDRLRATHSNKSARREIHDILDIKSEMANTDMSIRLFNNDYNFTYIFMSL